MLTNFAFAPRAAPFYNGAGFPRKAGGLTT
jgi:hypothetical protein